MYLIDTNVMRIILNINDKLMREVKRRAAKTGQTITHVIESALRQAFACQQVARSQPFKLRWVTMRGRLRPGVDLTDRDSLYKI